MQRNAAAFGGDPGNVTLFGESYGGLVEALGASVASERGCADPPTALACLRRVPVKSLFAHAAGFQPYAFGGRVLAGHPVTAEQYPTLLAEAFGSTPPSADPLSAVAYGSPNLAWAAVLTGRMWARETFHAAEVPYLFPDQEFLDAITPPSGACPIR